MAAKKKKTEVEKEVKVSKKVKEKETSTLVWFFVVVVVVFASFLIPYSWNESSKFFEVGNISFMVEDYEDLEIFHGRFVSMTNPNLNFNIFLREDPRDNDVSVEGKLKDFKFGGVISFSPELDECRGDVSRVMLDLGSFLKTGIGVGVIETGSTDEVVANETGRRFATCENVDDRTVVLVEIGEDRGIVKDEANPFCYTITVEDCEDSVVVEKFIVQSVLDFREENPIS